MTSSQLVAKRRKEWLASNGPCKKCGATENLVVSYIKPTTEKKASLVWRLARVARRAELKLCEALCRDCFKPRRKRANHGTRRRAASGCECAICRGAYPRRKKKMEIADHERLKTPVNVILEALLQGEADLEEIKNRLAAKYEGYDMPLNMMTSFFHALERESLVSFRESDQKKFYTLTKRGELFAKAILANS